MNSLKKTARVAGFLYLLVTIAGLFELLYLPSKLFVSGDATATANNILAHESLFRASIIIGVVAEVLFVSVVLTLYSLLKGAGSRLAAVMVIMILIDAPLAFLGTSNKIATLAFVHGADFLAVFDKPQRDALATFLLNVDKQGVFVSEFFWGLWLIPLALLVYRSGFLPRLLGVWLFINGLAYLGLSFTGMLAPQHVGIAYKIAFPFFFGEMALMLWLLIVGARPKPFVDPAAAAG